MFSTMNFKRKITRVFLLENFGSYWAQAHSGPLRSDVLQFPIWAVQHSGHRAGLRE